MLSKTDLPKLALLLIFALIQTGCSVSMSVESSSDSVSTSSESITSISTSSSGSSEDEEKEEKEKIEQTTTVYQEDIAALTVLFQRHEKTEDEFKRYITEIAAKHGINDWEQEDSTFRAMGIGLKRAGIGEKVIQDSPYFKTLPIANYKLVLEGYQE